MGLETATYLNELVTTNPVGAADQRSQGDDHIRLIKSVLQATFPGLAGRFGRVQTKSGTYALVATDNATLLSCSGAPWTLSAPASSSMGNGFMVFVYNASSSNVITFDPNASETVNGALTFSIPELSWALLIADGANWVAISPTAEVNAAAATVKSNQSVLCPFQTLSMDYASGTTVTVSATGLVLFTASGAPKPFSASLSALSLNIAVSGAAGLDTGTPTNSTWYHIWAIGKTDGTLSAVFSISTSAPTLPSGYTYYGYLGAIRRQSDGTFRKTRQRGVEVVQSAYLITSDVPNTSFTLVNPTGMVDAFPPTAKVACVRLDTKNNTGSTNTVFSALSPDNDSAGIGIQYAYATNLPSGQVALQMMRMPFLTPQVLYYQNSIASVVATVYSHGWTY